MVGNIGHFTKADQAAAREFYKQECLRTLRRFLTFGIIGLFLASIIWQMWIDHSYAMYMPRTPDPVAGRVHQMVVEHGTEIYVTSAELWRSEFSFRGLIAGQVALLCLLAFMLIHYDDFEDPDPEAE